MDILCINSGSSSLKLALYRMSPEGEARLAEGSVAEIGQPGAAFPDHVTALRGALEKLSAQGFSTFDGAGHRLVSGGPRYLEPIRIDADFKAHIRDYLPFAPLHLEAEIAAIDAIATLFAQLPQVACFDTSFHRNMPERASRLPLPRSLWGEGMRNYGFHGLSFEYIVSVLNGAPGRTIIAHLGNGASLAAVRDGNPVDTTMGLTPTAGLIMGTRCGDLDPGVLLYLLKEKQIGPSQLEHMLNEQSGLLGISGISSDMQKLLEERERVHEAAQAVEFFCYSARKHVAAMAAALGGLDTLVFTGGIGEHAPSVRAEICAELGFLGIELDPDANAGNERSIGNLASGARVFVIPTDEDLMIARHSYRLLEGVFAS